MNTLVAAIFFGLAAAMGVVMIMAPGFVWFHLLKMRWPDRLSVSPLRMTLYCMPSSLLLGALLTWHAPANFTDQSQRWLLAAVLSCLVQTPVFFYWQYRRNKR